MNGVRKQYKIKLSFASLEAPGLPKNKDHLNLHIVVHIVLRGHASFSLDKKLKLLEDDVYFLVTSGIKSISN